MDTATFTRDELHDLVWSTPVSKLAKRFGISDVGLAKVCDRHEIPRPPRGYWAKVQAGKRVDRKPLPPLALSQRPLRTIEIRPIQRRSFPAGESSRSDEAARMQPGPDAASQNDLVPRDYIVVSESLRNPHTLLKPLRYALRASFCRKCYGRVLRSADAVIRYLEDQVHVVEVSRWGGPAQFTVTIEGQVCVFAISEETKDVQCRKRIAPDEQRWWQDSYEIERVKKCTGRLAFAASGGRHGSKFSWTETDKRSIGNNLHKCASGLLRVAAAERAAAQRAEEAQRRREKEEADRRRGEEEERRLQEIEDFAARWDKAERIRAFVDAARAQNGGGSEDGSASWMQEALAHADRIDPLQADQENVLKGR